MKHAWKDRYGHIFTVDVEEYFQVNAFEDTVAREDWHRYPSLVGKHIDMVLELLDEHDVYATFFVLGWIADRHPGVVRRIAEAGHEIASHGWDHHRLQDLSPEDFREEVRTSRALLEDVSGQAVLGFRAPSFSVVTGREWALDILLEEGYRYDSSLFPIWRPDYGYREMAPAPHLITRSAGTLLELPPATTTWGGIRVPAGGGAYFRHFPYAVCQRAFRERRERNIAGVFYIHPWELDPEQPRFDVRWPTRIRHYGGLDRTVPRLRRLLGRYRFGSVGQVFPNVTDASAPQTVPAGA